MSVTQAIKAALVVASADEATLDAAVLLDGDKVADVVPNAQVDVLVASGELAATAVLDRTDCLLAPGLVNAHMHQYGVLSHGIPPAQGVVDFEGFLGDYWWPRVEDRITKREVLTTTRATMALMLRSGTTAFCDILEAPFCEPDTLEAQGEAIAAVGMRGVVSLESSERAGHENGQDCLAQNARAAAAFANHPLVSGAICTHTTFTCPEAMIAQAADMARDLGCLYQFHLCESRYERDWAAAHLGCTPTEVYRRVGALGPSTLAAQCVKLGEGDLALLAGSGTLAAHLPISNCEVGGGFAPVPAMLEAGLRPGLGTDGYVNDMFQVMRAAFLVHKAACETTDVMGSREVFALATEGGAAAMGLARTGRLETGWAADLMAYRMGPQVTPINENNVYDQLVVFGQAANVRDVWVAGARLMDDGALTTLDEERDAAELRLVANDFWRGL